MIAHKQNDILRILTIFCVVLLPLTLITGIFGMNFGHSRSARSTHGFCDHRRRDDLVVCGRPARLLPLQAVGLTVTEQLWAPWRLEYVQPRGDAGGCVFCAKAAAGGDAAALIVHRGAHAYVLMNLYPYSNGHVMVAPYRHVATPGDLNEAERAELWALLISSVRALTAAMSPHGFNAGLNLGRVAGAGVEGHLHLHVVPRWNGDTNFMPVLADVKVMPEHISARPRSSARPGPSDHRGTVPMGTVPASRAASVRRPGE